MAIAKNVFQSISLEAAALQPEPKPETEPEPSCVIIILALFYAHPLAMVAFCPTEFAFGLLFSVCQTTIVVSSMQMWLCVELNVILIRQTFIQLQWNCRIKINTGNFRIEFRQ